MLMWNTDVVEPEPTSCGRCCSIRPRRPSTRASSGSTTIGLHRRRRGVSEGHQPDLGIDNPYELDDEQFNAAVDLLKQQRPNVGEYWLMPRSRSSRSRTATSSSARPGSTSTSPCATSRRCRWRRVLPAGRPPRGGRDRLVGHLDDLGQEAPHPNCMYKWMDFIVSPMANAEAAQAFGQAPAQSKACETNTLTPATKAAATRRIRSSATSTGQRMRSSRKNVYYWITPVADCGDDRGEVCKDNNEWVAARPRSRGDVLAIPMIGRSMEAAGALAPARRRSAGRRLADFFHGHAGRQVGALLSGPGRLAGHRIPGLAGVLLVAVVLVASTPLGGELEKVVQPRQLPGAGSRRPVYKDVALRTIGVAAAATVTDAILGFPIAFYMAKVASPRMKGLLIVAILMPLWAFYLVKVYAWRAMLCPRGDRELGARPVRAQRPRLRHDRGLAGRELPLAAVHDPADLRRPRAAPGLAARRLRGPRRQALGDLPAGGPAAGLPGRRRRLDLHLLADPGRLHRALARLPRDPDASATSSSPTTANNLPLASAFAMVPIVVMVVYLLVAGGSERSRIYEALGRPQRDLLRVVMGVEAGLHLRPAAGDRDQRIQRRDDAEVAAGRVHHRVVREGARQPARATPSGPRSRSGLAPPRSPWSWARSRRSPCTGSGSSAGRPCRCWW